MPERKTPLWGNVWRLGRCGTAAWRTKTEKRAPEATTHAAIPHTRREDGGQGLQRPPAGPKRGMQGLAEALRGRRPRIGPQWPLTRSLEALAGSFRGHGVSWARRGLVRRLDPCDASTMPPKDRTGIQVCAGGVRYAGVETGPCGLTMGRRGKTAHAAARSRAGPPPCRRRLP